MGEGRKLLVVDVAALGWELVSARAASAATHGLSFRRLETVFPALTCPVQASFRTEALPCFHGVCGNGFFDRKLARPFFWEQSAGLVYGRRIWENLRDGGRKVGLMFWQQSLGESADLILSPRPIHKHHGGMIQDCYSQPSDLYGRLSAKLGRPFNLARYWGPLASHESSAWIAEATGAVLRDPALAPDLLLSYLPHLDYDLQRHGPGSAAALQALEKTFDLLSTLWKTAAECGYDCLFFGDYAMAPVSAGVVYPNRCLREAGLLRTRRVRGREYPDFYTSEAFALADHEVALVYVRGAEAGRRARAALEALPGVAEVLDAEAQRCAGIDDPIGPELIAVAAPGAWCAYPWWAHAREAPDYATHVDIHNKPGYDPCELFFGFPPPGVSQDPARICGTHGRAGPERAVAWTASWTLRREPATVPDLAKAVQDRMENVP